MNRQSNVTLSIEQLYFCLKKKANLVFINNVKWLPFENRCILKLKQQIKTQSGRYFFFKTGMQQKKYTKDAFTFILHANM